MTATKRENNETRGDTKENQTWYKAQTMPDYMYDEDWETKRTDE